MTPDELRARGISFSGKPNTPPPRFLSIDWFRYCWWSFAVGFRRGWNRPK